MAGWEVNFNNLLYVVGPNAEWEWRVLIRAGMWWRRFFETNRFFANHSGHFANGVWWGSKPVNGVLPKEHEDLILVD